MDRQTAIKAFWEYAQENLKSINLIELKESFDNTQKCSQSVSHYLKLSSLLSKINEMAFIKFTLEPINGKQMNIMVLCASGDIENYEDVNDIYKWSLQYKFDDWIIRKFLPCQKSSDFVIYLNNIEFLPKDIKFCIRRFDGKLEVNFVISKNAAQHIHSSKDLETLRMSFDIFLDTLTGEYINKKYIDYLNIFPSWSIGKYPELPPIAEWKPFEEILDSLKRVIPNDPSCYKCGIGQQHVKFIEYSSHNYCPFCFNQTIEADNGSNSESFSKSQ